MGLGRSVGIDMCPDDHVTLQEIPLPAHVEKLGAGCHCAQGALAVADEPDLFGARPQSSQPAEDPERGGAPA